MMNRNQSIGALRSLFSIYALALIILLVFAAIVGIGDGLDAGL